MTGKETLQKKQPPMTAASLIEEMRSHRKGEPANLETLIVSLPEVLRECLDAVLSDFDYRASLGSNTAIGCRMLSVYIGAIEYRLKEFDS
ncbi:hypothetical protein [Desulfuromonas thiophila]|uniref:hypothetical protein n=1 Tax=Desulfuromonas thiophila TaxID=57664 RepID=UPI0024A7B3AF|nr:hypothetical protein [Desulfuromonas thiophila]